MDDPLINISIPKDIQKTFTIKIYSVKSIQAFILYLSILVSNISTIIHNFILYSPNSINVFVINIYLYFILYFISYSHYEELRSSKYTYIIPISHTILLSYLIPYISIYYNIYRTIENYISLSIITSSSMLLYTWQSKINYQYDHLYILLLLLSILYIGYYQLLNYNLSPIFINFILTYYNTYSLRKILFPIQGEETPFQISIDDMSLALIHPYLNIIYHISRFSYRIININH